MEPLSALFVAAAVVQFVDFGSKIIASTFKIYEPSALQEKGSDSIRVITGRLMFLNDELKRSATFLPLSTEQRSKC